jgi:hypothetical protein
LRRSRALVGRRLSSAECTEALAAPQGPFVFSALKQWQLVRVKARRPPAEALLRLWGLPRSLEAVRSTLCHLQFTPHWARRLPAPVDLAALVCTRGGCLP